MRCIRRIASPELPGLPVNIVACTKNGEDGSTPLGVLGELGGEKMAVTTRLATIDDLPEIVKLLADDALGRDREDPRNPLPAAYYAAFAAIDADPNNEILVATKNNRVVATLQITYTPSLSYQGSWRATLESVRTAAQLRGQGIGTVLMQAAIRRARERGCGSVQLTTNKTRTDARRFYERLGFAASHEGMKLAFGELK